MKNPRRAFPNGLDTPQQNLSKDGFVDSQSHACLWELTLEPSTTLTDLSCWRCSQQFWCLRQTWLWQFVDKNSLNTLAHDSLTIVYVRSENTDWRPRLTSLLTATKFGLGIFYSLQHVNVDEPVLTNQNKILQKVCQKWDSNPRPHSRTRILKFLQCRQAFAWVWRLRPLGHPDCWKLMCEIQDFIQNTITKPALLSTIRA